MNLGFVSMAALAVASLPPGCGQVFNASVEVDDLCKTLDEQDFPAAADAGEAHVTREFTVNVGDILNKIDAAGSSTLQLKSVSLQPTEGIDDLAFVEQLTLVVMDGAQAATLTQYQHAASDGPVPVLTLKVNEVDMRSDASDGEVTLSADLAGILPTVSWKAKVTACFTASASL